MSGRLLTSQHDGEFASACVVPVHELHSCMPDCCPNTPISLDPVVTCMAAAGVAYQTVNFGPYVTAQLFWPAWANGSTTLPALVWLHPFSYQM